jgi:hypothetical protein
MPALPEPKDVTRNKISEAKYFLHMIEDRRDAYLSGKGDNELCLRIFEYFLSAFLCSARSILDYMKVQYGLDGTIAYRKFYDGYMQKGGKFRELKFFNDIRVENVHYKFGNKEPYKIRQRDQVSLDYSMGALIVSQEEAARRMRDLSARQEAEKSQPQEEGPIISRVPIELLFLRQEGLLDKDTEVIEFCERQLKTMIGLAELCENGKFTLEELDAFLLTS